VIRAVLFDLDGVLVETRSLHRDALDTALVAAGFPPVGPASHPLVEGLPTRVKLEKLASVTGYEEVAGHVDRIVKVKNKLTREMIPQFVKFDPATYCLFAGLDALNVRIAVVTNAIRDTAQRCIDLLLDGFRDFDIDIVSPSDGYRPKPARDIYDAAVTKVNLPPDECLAVEDNDKGVRSAAAAGCRVWQIESPRDLTANALWAEVKNYGGFR
jgi:beta-phosphoglucomutase